MRLTATHTRAAASSARPLFDPKSLWANGEQGFLYDYTDWRTLFQTVDGQTPVTAAGQPVALALDTRFGVPVRRNLFTNSKTVIPTGTTTADYDALVVPYGDSTLSMDYLKDTTSNGEHYGERQYSVFGNTAYTFSFFVKGDGSGKLAYIRTALRGTAGMRIDLATGVTTTISGTGANGAIAYGNGLWRIWVTYITASAGTGVFRPQVMTSAAQGIYTGDGTGYYVGGHQLEIGGLTDYQGIGANWAVTAPGNHAVQASSTSSRALSYVDPLGVQCAILDGVDDYWQTPVIDLRGYSQLTPFVAARKSSATAGSIMGQTNSISFAGFWELGMRMYANNDIALTVAGNASNTVQNYTSYGTGLTHVITAQINGVGATMEDYFALEVGGLSASTGATTAGPYSVGGFKSEAITLGCRGSGASRFAGNLYVTGLRTGRTDMGSRKKMAGRITRRASGPTLPMSGAALALDFLSNYYRVDNDVWPGVADIPGEVFTRGSSKTALDLAGNTVSFASGIIPLTTRGLLIEQQAVRLNNADLTTNTVAVTAQAYTVQWRGSGSITLSGATSAVIPADPSGYTWVTFIPVAGNLTMVQSVGASSVQLEVGTMPTSYIPGAGSTVTRLADNLTLSGRANSLAPPLTMVCWIEATGHDSTGIRDMIAVSDGTANNRVYLRRTADGGTEVGARVLGAGQPVALMTAGDKPGSRILKMAVRIRSGTYRASVDGVLGSEVAFTNPSNLSTVSLGSSVGTLQIGAYIQRAAIYGDCTDTQLQGFTQ